MIFAPLIHFAAGQPGSFGAGVSFTAPTRFQSRPSISAESCAADRSHHAVLNLRPLETAVFKTFREQTHARPVPENQLYPVGAFGAEHVDRAVEWIGAHHVANQRHQTFRPFAEVDRPRRDEHAHRARQTDHLAAFSAPMIALTIATSAPDHTQTLDPSMSNSIKCGRASPVLFSPTSGDCATLELPDDDRREGRHGDIHLNSTARLPTPGEQLLRRQPVAARDVTDQRAILQTLRDNRRLLLSRPDAPPTHSGEDLQPPRRSCIVGLVITL